MKRMLINATQPEELRVALVDGQRLYDLDIESGAREQKKANIYRGRITRVEPSLEAAFVDFGADRHGFLPLKEISREYFSKEPSGNGRPNIREVIKEGQEVIVQVDKEERGNKGAALTTFISLAGRFLVLMPNNPRAGGISRRIEGDERTELKEAMSQLTMPEKMGVIVRTAGIGRSSEELQWDLDYLVQVWETITEEAGKRSAPFLIYRESNVIIRAMRDYLRQDIGEVLIDHGDVHEEALNFVKQVMPSYQQKIKLYNDDVPLFSRFQIESQIETAYEREVKLPSGGSVVIDHTEALVSIDINSSRATKGGDIEETALQTNLEAADEIARQLRLRDIGGLVVIDFIDMSPARNQREVENRVRDALKLDRARVQIGRISRFGLMEMSRQRLRPSLGETSGVVCPRCNGQGTIRDVRSLSLSIMRLIEEEAMKDRSSQIRAMLPVPVATYLLNEKRNVLTDIERRQGVRVMLLPQPELETPHYDVQRYRDDQVDPEEAGRSSFELSDDFEAPEDESETYRKPVKRTEAAVRSVAHRTPAPEPVATPVNEEPSGFLSRLMKGFNRLMGSEESSQQQQSTASSAPSGKENTRPAAREEKPQSSTQDNAAREAQKSSSNSGDQRNNRRDSTRRDDTKRDDSAGNRNGRNDKRTSSDKGRDDRTRRDRPSRDSEKSDGAGSRNDRRQQDKSDNVSSERGDKRQNSGSASRSDNNASDRADKRTQGGSTSRGDNNTSDRNDKHQQSVSNDKGAEKTRDDGDRQKPAADAQTKVDSAQNERTSSSSTQSQSDDSGKPRRTRNNPRQRSRKQALNPEAVAEQERLQAEAGQSGDAAAADATQRRDNASTSTSEAASAEKAGKASKAPTSPSDSTSTPKKAADTSDVTPAYEQKPTTSDEKAPTADRQDSASDKKAPAASGTARKSVSATFGRESASSETTPDQQESKTGRSASAEDAPVAASEPTTESRNDSTGQKASSKEAAGDKAIAGAAAAAAKKPAVGDAGKKDEKRASTETTKGTEVDAGKSEKRSDKPSSNDAADTAPVEGREDAQKAQKGVAPEASEATPREQPHLVAHDARGSVRDRASSDAPARDINKQSVTTRDRSAEKSAARSATSSDADSTSDHAADNAAASETSPSATPADTGKSTPRPSSGESAEQTGNARKTADTAARKTADKVTTDSAEPQSTDSSDEASAQPRQRRRAHNDPRERRRQQQRENQQSSGE
ncbi:RNAse E [Kushneria avicenniae]|uniref:Ribonuclease E n=1 Tax=Kushneria avicenniae TaxID=402385 RepID=A0A1I1FWX2_9GAMM|nr:ribonuclease E [Kushneria avicenniae]SFC03834.1 RNAse E [Kushneria avicenniae]